MVAGCVRTDGCVGWRKGCGRKLDPGTEERSVPGPMLQRPLERQRTPAPAERTGPCPLLHDEAPAREPPGIRHPAPEPPIDAARAPVPDPGARDGVHAADPSGVRVRLPVLEGFPLDLGQPGTNVKARCNRVHDAGGGARRPPRARMLSDSPSRPQKGGENTRIPALRSLFELATRHSMPRTHRIP